MKCPSYEIARMKKTENISAPASVDSKALQLKASPVKEPPLIKPHHLPAKVGPALFPLKDTSAVYDKENSASKEHDRTLDDGLEDSGYMSLHTSQISDHHVSEEDDPPSATAARGEKRAPWRKASPYQKGTGSSCSLVVASTPVDRSKGRQAAHSLFSTPSEKHCDPNLPLLKFQQAVCEELAKSYQKNKRYDWSIVSKVAESHFLDRVIGGQMGQEYIDMFSSLLSRNMKSVLTSILVLLGDMDLISCKKVSRTWRKIICEDTAALRRCERAEKALQESRSSLRQRGCGLTRDGAVSRVVLSCMQALATPSSSSSSPASSTSCCGVNRGVATSQKSSKSTSQGARFSEYTQAASSLKQHESLRPCKRCGSPATHSAEVQRATCTRSNCKFDFCTCCREAFHGSTPCRVVEPRLHFPTSDSTSIIPGSARSKRNIRRL
ncbi:F-box only protein 5 [Aulostomus maculatus]